MQNPALSSAISTLQNLVKETRIKANNSKSIQEIPYWLRINVRKTLLEEYVKECRAQMKLPSYVWTPENAFHATKRRVYELIIKKLSEYTDYMQERICKLATYDFAMLENELPHITPFNIKYVHKVRPCTTGGVNVEIKEFRTNTATYNYAATIAPENIYFDVKTYFCYTVDSVMLNKAALEQQGYEVEVSSIVKKFNGLTQNRFTVKGQKRYEKEIVGNSTVLLHNKHIVYSMDGNIPIEKILHVYKTFNKTAK